MKLKYRWQKFDASEYNSSLLAFMPKLPTPSTTYEIDATIHTQTTFKRGADLSHI